MSLTAANAGQLLSLMEGGDASATEVTQACLDRIAAQDPQIGAFIHVDSARALEQAARVDSDRRAGKALGPLAGLPVAVKDILCTRDQPTTCASRMLQNFRPPYDADTISRLRAADAIILGKTNLDEFAMGSSVENSAVQLTRNPWDTTRTPGGSSGGSAAAVAAGMCPLAVGTDTGGSIRQPASFCGVVGLKPTYGRVSRYGLIAYASSLDQTGPLANDVRGAAGLLQAIAGHDPRDSTSVQIEVPDYTASLETPISDLRIGVPREYFSEGLSPDVSRCIREAIDVLRSQGAQTIDISLPHLRYSVAAYYLIAPSEASSNLARYDGVHYGYRGEDFDDLIDMYCVTRGAALGAEVKRRIMLGTYALSAGYYDAYYLKALRVRRLIRQDFDQAFDQVDVIAGPVAPTAAFELGEFKNAPLSMYLTDIYTIGANLAGIPGMSLPAGFTPSGLPVGLQLLAAPFAEETLLRSGRMFERETTWHTRRATLER
jgi:aspartyl-tRNA(Asn)/glutamyl-tRNA(Gln) amidotransferase subunit A